VRPEQRPELLAGGRRQGVSITDIDRLPASIAQMRREFRPNQEPQLNRMSRVGLYGKPIRLRFEKGAHPKAFAIVLILYGNHLIYV
jgi:hypothetical protein